MPNGVSINAEEAMEPREIVGALNRARQMARKEEVRETGQGAENVKELTKLKEKLKVSLTVLKSVYGQAKFIILIDSGLDAIDALNLGTLISLFLIPIKFYIYLTKIKNIIGGMTSGAKIVTQLKIKSGIIYFLAWLLELIPFVSALPISFSADVIVNRMVNGAIEKIEKQIKTIDEMIKKKRVTNLSELNKIKEEA